MPIPEFVTAEPDTLGQLLALRYKSCVETHLADSELRLDPDHGTLTVCPTVFWQARGCNFVVIKTGEGRFRCLFFYAPDEQFATGHTEYTDLETCVAAVSQVQSDHERETQGVASGSTGKHFGANQA